MSDENSRVGFFKAELKNANKIFKGQAGDPPFAVKEDLDKDAITSLGEELGLGEQFKNLDLLLHVDEAIAEDKKYIHLLEARKDDIISQRNALNLMIQGKQDELSGLQDQLSKAEVESVEGKLEIKDITLQIKSRK